MSWQATQHVWKTSRQKGVTLLVLLAIAEQAHADGTGSYAAIATLARMARTTKRTVSRAVVELTNAGEIAVIKNAGPRGTNAYTVPMVGSEVMPWADAKRRPDVTANDAPSYDATSHDASSGMTADTPEPPVPTLDTSLLGTGGSSGAFVTPDGKSPLTPAREAKLQGNEAKKLWWRERERHRQKSGEAFARFTDRRALANLVVSLARAVKLGTWADVQSAIRSNASRPESNPWYLDEWTRVSAGQRAEAERLQQKMAERTKEDNELRREYRRKPMKSIGELLPSALRGAASTKGSGEVDVAPVRADDIARAARSHRGEGPPPAHLAAASS